MTFTKIAVAAGVVLLGLACWLAAAGFGAAREGLISLFALAVLVGGGNLLAGRSSGKSPSGAPSGANGGPASPADPRPAPRASGTDAGDEPAP